MQMSATVDADVCDGRCGCLRRSMRMLIIYYKWLVTRHPFISIFYFYTSQAPYTPNNGMIDGVSNEVRMPLSVSPRLAYAPCTGLFSIAVAVPTA